MFWIYLAICLHPASPSPPPLFPEPIAKSEKEKGEKEGERDLAILPSSPLPFPPPLHPEPRAESERRKKERARAHLSPRRACFLAFPDSSK